MRINVPPNLFKTEILILFIFYFIAHVGILFIPNSIFWDDWVIYRSNPNEMMQLFKDAGSMFNFAGYLHKIFLHIGLWSYKALTFLLMFLSGALLYLILQNYSMIDKKSRFLIVLLFLILPLNSARVALINFPYTVSYFLFFLGWFLVSRNRLVSLICFFISFNTNSLLVFYLLPFLEIVLKNKYQYNWLSFITELFKNIDYLLLPFIYFFIKTQFFKPNGAYSGYNEDFRIQYLIQSPMNQFIDLMAMDVPILFASLLSIISYFILKKFLFLSSEKKNFLRINFFLGIFIFILGAFPYWILGYTPTFKEWDSRHQLLLPLGSSIFLVSIYELLRNQIKKNFFCLGFLSLIIGLSLAINIIVYFEFFRDWKKQGQLIQLFSKNQTIEKAKLIIINDTTQNMNAINRTYRFYEWNGIMELAFNSQTRFVINKDEISQYFRYPDIHFSSRYKAGQYYRQNQTSPIFLTISVLNNTVSSPSLIYQIFPIYEINAIELDQPIAK